MSEARRFSILSPSGADVQLAQTEPEFISACWGCPLQLKRRHFDRAAR